MEIFLIVELVVHIIFFCCNIPTEIKYLLWTPRKIYKSAKVNWFGAIFIYLIYFCVVPLYAIIAFMIWACTVGRE